MTLKPLCNGVLLAFLGLALTLAPAHAETVAASGTAHYTQGYTLFGWLNTLSIVEQVQTVHRLSKSSSQDAVQGLVTALNSPYELARRKASRSLLEKVRNAEGEDKRFIVLSVAPSLENTDPVVQGNLVRLMLESNTPEASSSLNQFFKDSQKPAQINAVNALSQESSSVQKHLISIINQASPYSEVRQAAADNLRF